MFGGSDSSDGGGDFDSRDVYHQQQQQQHHHRHQRSGRTDQRPTPGGGGVAGGGASSAGAGAGGGSNVGRDYHHPPRETRHFRSGGGGGGSGGADSDISGLGSDLAVGPGQPGEQELASKMLQIQSKRFYLDVKQNRRGRFIKVAEIGADGRRSQIFLALSTAAEFRGHLSSFSDFYASLGSPPNPDNLPEDGKLKSEMMTKDNRRYYLDLKENSRGRFLRVSQTIARGGPRSQIAIPAQGMIEFRDALTDLLEEFGTDDGGFKGELPEGRHLRVENKNFYFDIGQNNRGIYMRISEVKTNYRTAVTIPEKSWSRFRDIFSDYVDKMKDGGSGGATGGGGGGAAAVTPTSSSVAADNSPGPSSGSHKK
ncbi:transcriptional activator protein Pur-alpha-like isoform X1 [Daphnia pulex]|uniref:transcriptional activator protein Pur-alpha-like isoform X1 n=1 Tax=Daphnia pulex TaxID=6669 RepID=UPI001EDD5710|nr:transcriptional activator protein Pur-alpha-like isoform X1 [Daphnia pulex]